MRERASRHTRTWAWLVIAAAYGADALHTAAPAAAPTPEAPASITISTADLDLSTRAGTEALYRRIRRAARDVCHRGLNELYLQRSRTDGAGCYRRTIAAAIERARLPMLTSMYRRHEGG